MSQRGRGHRGKDKKGANTTAHRERVRRRKLNREKRAKDLATILEAIRPACDLSRLGVAFSSRYNDETRAFNTAHCTIEGLVKLRQLDVGPPVIIGFTHWNNVSAHAMRNMLRRAWEPVMRKSPLWLLAECAEGVKEA